MSVQTTAPIREWAFMDFVHFVQAQKSGSVQQMFND
jgi:hypothetical protein